MAVADLHSKILNRPRPGDPNSFIFSRGVCSLNGKDRGSEFSTELLDVRENGYVDDIGHLQRCPQHDLVRSQAGNCLQMTYVVHMLSARHPLCRPQCHLPTTSSAARAHLCIKPSAGFLVMQFFGKIVCWRPHPLQSWCSHLGEILDPPLNRVRLFQRELQRSYRLSGLLAK